MDFGERGCDGGGTRLYERLDVALNAEKLDQRVGAICRPPSITPGRYFRMLLLGYFEGIDSERSVAWRAAGGFRFHKFLGYDLIEPTPDHSTGFTDPAVLGGDARPSDEVGVTAWVLVDAQSGCIDATILQANAAMKSQVRRDTGLSYDDYLRQLAQAEGLEIRLKSRWLACIASVSKKASNDDWTNPNDPSARIAINKRRAQSWPTRPNTQWIWPRTRYWL